MPNTFTIEEAKKILQVDEDFDDSIVQMYLDIADGQIKTQTGYDFSNEPNPDSKDYVRKSILMQHYSSNTYNKEYDFTFGMHADITRLSILARKKAEEDATNKL